MEGLSVKVFVAKGPAVFIPVVVFQVRNHPLNSSSEDDDPGFHDIPFPEDSAMQQVNISSVLTRVAFKPVYCYQNLFKNYSIPSTPLSWV